MRFIKKHINYGKKSVLPSLVPSSEVTLSLGRGRARPRDGVLVCVVVSLPLIPVPTLLAPQAAIHTCLMGVLLLRCVLVNYVLLFCVHGLFIYINGVGL